MTDSLRERISSAIGSQYRIEHEIGRGGMSVVYRAHDLRLNRPVAIKVLPPELAHDPAVRSRFTREAQTSAQLSHPHIVPIFDVGERDGMAYFVMALVTGGTLANRIDRQALRPVDEVKRILAEVADALAYAHLRGVIHRDIKTDNILMESDAGRAIVTDFGIARAMEEGGRLTQTGIAVGTPTYMSPEQAVGDRDIDGRSDVYSLGVVGYQMLTGRVPFSAGNAMALLLKHVSERPQPILELRPETPKPLADAIEKALAKTPETRWPTAAAFRDAINSNESLAAWRADQREPVRYSSPVPRSSRRPTTTPLPSQTRAQTPKPIELEPPHLAALTPEQRRDIRLWHGRVNLLDRVKFVRRYAFFTVGLAFLSIAGFVIGVEEGNPLFLTPIVPVFMSYRLRQRSLSLRESGLKLKRVFTKLRAKNALPSLPVPPSDRKLQKMATKAVLQSPHGAVIRRAAGDRASIIELVNSLPREDRAMVSEVKPTVEALFERVIALAQSLHKMEGDIDPSFVAELDDRIASFRNGGSLEEQRQLALLQRQRDTIQQLAERRSALVRQMESAALALGNLRLDLIKLRSSGVESALQDVSNATQEARALSREIAVALDVAAELRDL
jgi:serine/threonine-protein kinase